MKDNFSNTKSLDQTSGYAAEAVKEQKSGYDKWQPRVIAPVNGLLLMTNYVKHRVNTQISNLNMLQNLIEETTLSKKQKELFKAYKQISSELSGLIHTVEDNLRLSQFDGDEVEAVELQPIFDRMKRSFTKKIEQNDATLYADFSEEPVVKFDQRLLLLIFEKFIASSLDHNSSDRTVDMKVYTVVKPAGIHLVFENNAPVYNILHNGETSDQALFKHNLKRAVEQCGARFEAANKEKFGNRYSIIF
ncbi:MAG: hypothetical protein WBG71_04590 [Leeuwenhoekiella sp.]